MSSSKPPYTGNIPMVRIDGEKIRRFRENKGLTQLYLSTVVGVTTDTISRWENRRYPTIKLENAEKLAQALEIDLSEILEKDGTKKTKGEKKGEAGHTPSPLPGQGQNRFLLASAVLILIIAATGLWFYLSSEKATATVSADRILPHHVAPGQTFPVLIRVKTSRPGPVTFILKESIPEGCTPSDAVPPFTTTGTGKNEVKWIARAGNGEQAFAYIIQAPVVVQEGTQLEFNGSVTLKQETKKQWTVQGSSTLNVEPYHWADSNKDNMIDDEEILTVYDVYSDTEELQLDLDLIDNIWSGSGYSWNAEKQTYRILK